MSLAGVSVRGGGPGGPTDRILSWPKVREITDLSRSTAWRRAREGDFPSAVKISPGRVGWWESEVNAWKLSRTHAPDTGSTRSTTEAPHVDSPAETPPLTAQQLTDAVREPVVRPEPPFFAAPSGKRPRKRRVCEGQIAFEF